MFAKLKAAWAKVLTWCHDSETIVLARATVLAGIVLGVVSQFDITSVIADGSVNWKHAAGVIAWGVFQEAVRRYKPAEDTK